MGPHWTGGLSKTRPLPVATSQNMTLCIPGQGSSIRAKQSVGTERW